MGQLIEVVFEGLTIEQARGLCTHLAGSRGASLVEESMGKSDGVAELELEQVMLSQATTLLGAHVRLLRYDSGPLDVELNFALEEVLGVQDLCFQRALQDFAKAAAEACGATTYFAGLEPASDYETRLFTGPLLGPVKL